MQDLYPIKIPIKINYIRTMNLSEQLDHLHKELKEIEARIESDHQRAKVIKSTIGKLNTQSKKIEKILGDVQKGVTE